MGRTSSKDLAVLPAEQRSAPARSGGQIQLWQGEALNVDAIQSLLDLQDLSYGQVQELARLEAAQGLTTQEQQRLLVEKKLLAELSARIVALGLSDRLRTRTQEEADQIVKFIEAVLSDLGHDVRDPHVRKVVADRLRQLDDSRY